jgi:S1-C subfamily serine protease
MLRWIMLVLMVSLCAACVGGLPADFYQPKLEKTGGPELLYLLKADDVKNYFPLGASRDVIVQRYGAPASSGANTNDGKATTYAVYSYSRTYTHTNTAIQTMIVVSSTSVIVTYDATGKLISHNLSSSATANDYGNRQFTPSDNEIQQYLGPKAALPAPLVLAGEARQAPRATVPGETGGSSTGWRLGVQIATPTAAEVTAAGLKSSRGAIIRSVDAGGLAAKAGLQAGDLVVKLNGSDVTSQADLADKIRASSTSESLRLQVLSKGKTRNLSVPAQTRAASGETSL